MNQVFKSMSFILLLKNADEEWEKLNAAAEKKRKDEAIWRSGIWKLKGSREYAGKKSVLCEMKR